MSHAHFHRHERRDIISEVESFLGLNNNKGQQQSTVTETASVVYVTASPTFTGAIGGYVTGTDTTTTADPTTTTGKGAPVAQSTKTTSTSKSETSSTTTTTKAPESTTHTTSTQSTTSTSLSDLLTTSSDPSSTTFVTSSSSTQSASSTSSTSTALDQFSSSTASATTSAAASASNGLTGGAKAGIAIGVLGGIGLIAGLVLFWLHKQRKNREEAAAAAAAAENEKFARSQPPPMTSAPPPQSMAAYSSTPSTPATAPQVSLRPITQFNPLLTQSGGANPYAAGAGVGAAAGAAAAGGLQVNRSAERPYSGSAHVPPQSPRQDPFTDPVNPFDNGAQAASPPMPPAKDTSSSVRDLTPSPTGSVHNLPSPIAEEGPSAGSVEAAAAVAGTAVGAAAVAAVAAAKSNDKPVEPRTPSPEYVENAGSRPQSPVVGGAGAPVSNVHRVQMDFTPSLADEMELRAGQLVRLLKSYDDGWVRISSAFR